jgi:hypothetical protein
VDENFDGLDRLNFMAMDGNAYNSTVPNALGGLQNLQFLFVADAFITGDLSYMEGMPAIVEHWIDINPDLSGTIPSFIGELTTLISFSVTENSMVGPLPTELGLLTNMVQMWFYANQLTGQIPSELGNLISMDLLQLEANMFTGIMPAEICGNRGFLRPLEILGADCNDQNFEVSSTIVPLGQSPCLLFVLLPD